MLPHEVTTYHARAAIDRVKNDPLLSDEQRAAALKELADGAVARAPIADAEAATAIDAAPKSRKPKADTP